MDPITMMAIGTVASAGIQWLNSKDAQNASADERQRMMDLLNRIQDPRFDSSFIRPDDIRVLQQYVPEVAPYLEEVAPQQVKAQSAGAIQGRQAQLDALGYMQKLVQQGYDPQTAVEMARAQRSASAEATSARQSAQAEAQRRGIGGGMSILQAGQGQGAQDSLANMQQQALAAAAQRRMGAAGQVGAMGSQIRGEDVALEQANVNAINAFNARQAAAKQNWANQGANTRNEGQRYNIGENQRVYEGNTLRDYDARVRQQGMLNTQAQQRYNNQMGKVTGQMPISAQTQQGYRDTAAQNNKTLQSMTDLGAKIAMEKWKYDNDPLRKG